MGAWLQLLEEAYYEDNSLGGKYSLRKPTFMISGGGCAGGWGGHPIIIVVHFG